MNSSLRFWITIFAVSVAGLLLRLHFAAEPLWLDELHTAWCVDAPASRISNRAGQGNQTPLFFWLSAGITAVSNFSPLSLRFISLLCGTAAILIAARFVFRASNNVAAAVTTAVLIASDPNLLFYSSEARPYAMLQLLSLMQFLAIVTLLQNDKRPRQFSWSIALLTFLVLSTHLTGGLLIAAELAILAWLRPRNIQPILTSLSLGCLAAAPLMLVALSVFENRGQWSPASGASQLFDGWRNPLLFQWLPAVTILAKTWPSANWQAKALVNGYKCIVILRSTTVLVAAWMIAPLLLSLILDRFSIPIASYRYTTVASLAPPVLIGLAIGLVQSRNMATVCAFMIVVGDLAINPITFSQIHDAQLPQYRVEDWESTIRFANNAQDETEKLVFLFSNIYEDAHALQDKSLQSYLCFPVRGIHKLDVDKTVIPMPTLVQSPWNSEHLQPLIKNGGALAICRVDDHRLNQIQNELSSALKKYAASVDFELFSQPGNSLKVLRFVVDQD